MSFFENRYVELVGNYMSVKSGTAFDRYRYQWPETEVLEVVDHLPAGRPQFRDRFWPQVSRLVDMSQVRFDSDARATRSRL